MHEQWWTAPRAISRERPATLEVGVLPVILGLATILSRWQVRPVSARQVPPRTVAEWRRLGKWMRVTSSQNKE